MTDRNAQIVALQESGVGPREIARRMRISPNIVAGVLHRHRHPYVGNGCGSGGKVGMDNPHARLTDDQVREIRSRRAAGEKLSVLEMEFGVHMSLISMIVNRKRWAHVD